MTNMDEKLHYIISHADADVNLCAIAFSMISEVCEYEQANLLETFLLEFKSTPTDGRMELPLIINKEEERELMRCYG